MDELTQQIQTLIDEAPNDGVTGRAVNAIAPTLKAIAQQLKNSQYYILQTLDQGWVMTTFNNRQDPDSRKNVIYAYPTLEDAGSAPRVDQDPQMMAVPLPVTHILFQMLALKSLDSLIFFDTPGDTKHGIEIRRQDFQNLLQVQLKESQGYTDPNANIG